MTSLAATVLVGGLMTCKALAQSEVHFGAECQGRVGSVARKILRVSAGHFSPLFTNDVLAVRFEGATTSPSVQNISLEVSHCHDTVGYWVVHSDEGFQFHVGVEPYLLVLAKAENNWAELFLYSATAPRILDLQRTARGVIHLSRDEFSQPALNDDSVFISLVGTDLGSGDATVRIISPPFQPEQKRLSHIPLPFEVNGGRLLVKLLGVEDRAVTVQLDFLRY